MSVASIGNNLTAVSNGTLKQHLSQGDTVYCYDRKKPYTKRMKRGEDGMPEDGRKPIKENYVYSGKDLEFNLDKWKPGGKNVLFITGLSGSGKSTKAAKLAKEYNAINIELDLFEHNNILFNKNTHNDEANLIVKEYFEKKYGGPKKFKFSDPGTGRYIYEFIEYCIGYARQHKDRLFIMEGIQLADLEMDDELKDEPVIIVHSSILKSMYRAAKREGIKDYIKSFDSFKGVVEYFRWYKEMDKNNKRLSKAMKEDASDEEDTSDTFLDDILNSIKDLDEEFEPFPTDILNEKL
jgi:hypothetical protein